ncbi:hypothetical protein QJS10_CPB18g01997 [Acorus calamus]|uniref:Uncharacterized protein n=1 Tax=Acorus calamus TaxID=4465 RepID=A0AAV9CQ14_ACOCL|nr:hypothetical protein QJS10_CPB18g01997 [Acorus calamus]
MPYGLPYEPLRTPPSTTPATFFSSSDLEVYTSLSSSPPKTPKKHSITLSSPSTMPYGLPYEPLRTPPSTTPAALFFQILRLSSCGKVVQRMYQIWKCYYPVAVFYVV